MTHNMTSRLKRFTLYWLPLFIYCLVIYIQSDHPSIEHIPSFEFSDKLLHFFAYAVLGVLFYRAYRTLKIKADSRMLILISIVSATLYGLSDEIHQYFVPFRNASIWDVVANTLGAICGVCLYHMWMGYRVQRTEDRSQITEGRGQRP